MEVSRASLPHWRTAVAVYLLTAAVAMPCAAKPATVDTPESCEAPLERLITILESKGQLTGTRDRYQGPPLSEDYSRCRIPQRSRSWPQYAVFRHNDNVTVVIEKRVNGREEPFLYGPFMSAYRK